jgi:predicted RNase H-like nuclease (RuvC/YqgF family)
MPPKPQEDRDQEQIRRFEALKARHEKLEREKVRLDTMIESQEAELARLRAEAEAAFGTSDPAELEKMLEARERENEERLAAFEANLRGVEEGLSALESGLGGGAAGGDA